MAGSVLERKAKIYLYGSDGVRILTPHHCGELYQHVEVISYEKLTEKQKKLQRKLDAVKRRSNGKSQKVVIR